MKVLGCAGYDGGDGGDDGGLTPFLRKWIQDILSGVHLQLVLHTAPTQAAIPHHSPKWTLPSVHFTKLYCISASKEVSFTAILITPICYQTHSALHAELHSSMDMSVPEWHAAPSETLARHDDKGIYINIYIIYLQRYSHTYWHIACTNTSYSYKSSIIWACVKVIRVRKIFRRWRHQDKKHVWRIPNQIIVCTGIRYVLWPNKTLRGYELRL